MSIELAYNQWSSTYDVDVNRTRDLDADVMRRLHAGLRVGTLVEAGCGTGKNTTFFAARAERLFAFDLSPEMLALARAKTTGANVEFRLHDLATPWPVAAGSVDFVTFNLVLEHVEHLESVFVHVARALRPGGTIVLSELHPYRQYRGKQARFTGADGNEVRVTAYTHHVSDYVAAARAHGLTLRDLGEWWHADDDRAQPRLLTLEFARGA